MDNAEIDAAVAELWERRIRAHSEVDNSLYPGERYPGLVAIEDATTREDIDMLHEARRSLDDRSRAILDLYVGVWRSFGRARCGVCGMTTNQSKAANYDCAREC